jgi:hypothetical protein
MSFSADCAISSRPPESCQQKDRLDSLESTSPSEVRHLSTLPDSLPRQRFGVTPRGFSDVTIGSSPLFEAPGPLPEFARMAVSVTAHYRSDHTI